MTEAHLHGYFRSSASYRVRIALHLKGIPYSSATYPLRKGAQSAPSYLTLNPQGLVPTLEIDDVILTQSLAICDYLEDTRPLPALLPADPKLRARVRAFAQVIACDIHPVQNLKILDRLRKCGVDEPSINGWSAQTINEGLAACDALIADEEGPFCFGSQVSMADICLVPQLVNARRFGVDLRWPRLLEIERACLAMDAFLLSAPERQPDAE